MGRAKREAREVGRQQCVKGHESELMAKIQRQMVTH